jgi:broad specificity phosphatase PhoE
MLHRIYLIRHGETADVAPSHKGPISAPTGNHADVYLSAIGIQQAEFTADRLALENLPIDVVYSSPHYHCLETLRPIVTDKDGKIVHEVRVENGLW